MSPRTVWWSLAVALAGVLLRVWHLILMKQALDPAWPLGAWIVAAWCVLGAMLALERRATSAGRSPAPQFLSRRPVTWWATLALFSCLLLLLNVGFQRAASDGRGYFVQVRSMVFDLDLDLADEIATFGARPADADYPLGTAIFWAPFFLAGHLWLGLLNLLGGDWPRDGFFNPYQRAVGLGTFVYGFLAVSLIARSLRRTFGLGSAMVAAFTVVLATPVVWYVAVDASMSHGVALFTVSAFLYVWLESRESRSGAQWIALGVLAAAMTSVRPQNALVLVVLAGEAIGVGWKTWRAEGSAARVLRSMWMYAAIALAAVAVIGLLLLTSVWQEVDGTLAETYLLRQGLFADWRVGDQLFSPLHGLVSNSPVLAFALLGMIALVRRDRLLGWCFLAIVVLQVLVGGLSGGWNAGASFGARRFVDLAMPFSFGLAAAIDVARRRPLLPVCVLVVALVAVNLFVVGDVRGGAMTLSDPLPFERMARAVSSRLGNPFALPASLWLAWRYDVPLAFYDAMPTRSFNELKLNIGGSTDKIFLSGAWLPPEHDGTRTFRWASNPEVAVLARLRRGSYRLSFEAEPFAWPDSPPQSVEVLVGDEVVGNLTLPGGLSRQELDLPKRLTPPSGIVRLGFRFAYARSPRELGLSDDARSLAARFVSIELRPR